MAKTFKNLYQQIYQFDRLYVAYLKARKGKRSRSDVIVFSSNLEPELIQLQNELVWGQYRTGPYHTFHVYEPKKRRVAALSFRDRVVQHALLLSIEPIWESRFIFDSYACRPNKGIHSASNRAQCFMRKIKRNHGKIYAFKADISKYFPSIDHEILKILIRKRIACSKTLFMIDKIIDSWEDSPSCGIPIGNLTSQLFANIYLHELDEFVKYSLREKYYLRYMDDFVVLHRSKSHLKNIRRIIETFLSEKLSLTTNGKTQIFPVATHRGRSLDFVGYKTWATHRLIRKSSANRIRRRLKKMRCLYSSGKINHEYISRRIASWLGYAKHADSFNLRKNMDLASFEMMIRKK